MIRTTIVSSRTFVSWWDHNIAGAIIKRISADSACMDSQGIIHLEKNHSIDGRMKIRKGNCHCQFTGQFRGAAHQHCNLDYKIDTSRYRLPIVFHNLRGYDGYLIFQKIKRKHSKINVIPNNSERYISFDVGRLKLLDSIQFLSCGVAKLAEQLSNDQFKHLKAAHPEHLEPSSKKGIYCYDYMNSME